MFSGSLWWYNDACFATSALTRLSVKYEECAYMYIICDQTRLWWKGWCAATLAYQPSTSTVSCSYKWQNHKWKLIERLDWRREGGPGSRESLHEFNALFAISSDAAPHPFKLEHNTALKEIMIIIATPIWKISGSSHTWSKVLLGFHYSITFM